MKKNDMECSRALQLLFVKRGGVVGNYILAVPKRIQLSKDFCAHFAFVAFTLKCFAVVSAALMVSRLHFLLGRVSRRKLAHTWRMLN